MTVFVIGATSQIGCFLLPYLSRLGEPILALSRKAHPSRTGVRWIRGRLPDEAPENSFLKIISFGPLADLATWLESQHSPAGVRLVATSSMSAESKRDSVVPAEREISQRLREGEMRLIAACARKSISWTILRPTLIYGAGLDKSLSPIARQALRLRIFPIPRGRGLRQPVHAEDVAEAAWLSLHVPGSAGQTIPLGGGERLSVEDMFWRVRRSLPAATLPIPVPGFALRGAARLQPCFRGPLLRMDTDLIADNRVARSVLGIEPRGFCPSAGSWGLHGQGQE